MQIQKIKNDFNKKVIKMTKIIKLMTNINYKQKGGAWNLTGNPDIPNAPNDWREQPDPIQFNLNMCEDDIINLTDLSDSIHNLTMNYGAAASGNLQNQQCQRDLAERTRELAEARRLLGERDTELVASRRDLAERTQELATARQGLDVARQEALATRQEIDANRQELATMRPQLETARRDLEGRTRELETARRELEERTQELVDLRLIRDGIQRRLEEAERNYVEAERIRRELEAKCAQYNLRIGEMRKHIKNLTNKINSVAGP
jgi:chromosome segregation ATPase